MSAHVKCLALHRCYHLSASGGCVCMIPTQHTNEGQASFKSSLLALALMPSALEGQSLQIM